MFRVSITPIIRSTQNCNYSLQYCAATSLQRGQASMAIDSVTNIWPVPEAVVRVLCTPDDGCDGHPKHVQWTCRIINRLRSVAASWTIANIVVKILIVVLCPGAWSLHTDSHGIGFRGLTRLCCVIVRMFRRTMQLSYSGQRGKKKYDPIYRFRTLY